MNTTTRKRKSEKLTPDEFKAFKKWVKEHDTLTDAFEALGVTMPTLDRALSKGSAHPDTIAKIRAKITA